MKYKLFLFYLLRSNEKLNYQPKYNLSTSSQNNKVKEGDGRKQYDAVTRLFWSGCLSANGRSNDSMASANHTSSQSPSLPVAGQG